MSRHVKKRHDMVWIDKSNERTTTEAPSGTTTLEGTTTSGGDYGKGANETTTSPGGTTGGIHSFS